VVDAQPEGGIETIEERCGFGMPRPPEVVCQFFEPFNRFGQLWQDKDAVECFQGKPPFAVVSPPLK